MSYEPDPDLRDSIKVDAYPEQVWEAWTDGDRLCQWFADKASGWPAVGSQLSLTWERFGFTVQYQIAEAVPQEKLVLKSRLAGGTQTMRVAICREGPRTKVEICEWAPQFGAKDDDSSLSGWQMALSIFKLYVEKYFGRPRSSFFCLSSANFTYPQILGAYSTREGLTAWLAPQVELADARLAAGQEYALVFEDGSRASGQVMAVTPHEVCLEWKEIQGYLELKSFSISAGQKAICLRGSGWGLEAEKAGAIEAMLEAALARLLLCLSPTPAE